MSEVAFPTARFIEAGIDPDEVAQLSDEFDRSDITAQASMGAHFAAISESGLISYVETLREGGHFDESSAAEEVESESMAADDDTVAESGATTKTKKVKAVETDGADELEDAPAED
jgi:hypothetical protein